MVKIVCLVFGCRFRNIIFFCCVFKVSVVFSVCLIFGVLEIGRISVCGVDKMIWVFGLVRSFCR